MTLSALEPATALWRKPPAAVQLPPPAAVPDDAMLDEISSLLAVHAPTVDAEGRFPHEAFEVVCRLGLPGLAVPQAHGGAGCSLAEARRVIAAVARGEPAAALVLIMQLLLSRALGRADCRWPAGPRERVLRSAVLEGALANNFRVEPELGSPARGGLPGTIARRVEGGWSLSGHKLYSTGVDGLRWHVVWGRTDEDSPRVGQFLVPAESPGWHVRRSWDHLGMRGTASDEVIYENVWLPDDHAVDIRPPAEWASRPDADQLAWMNVLLGSLYDAVARNARDWLLGFLRERAPGSLGAPLATLPRVQEAVGEIELLLQASRVQLDAAATAADAGQPWSPADTGLLKVGVMRNAIDVVERALRQSGNHGLSRQHPLQRHHRDVLCGRVHTPQEDAALVAAGLQALRPAPGAA